MRGMHRVIPLALGLLLAAMPIQAALAQNAGEDMIVQRIAAVYPGSEGSIATMRADGFGWGEIIMVLELSRLSGASVSNITAMRAGGMGFPQIAQALGIDLDPGQLGRAVANVMSEGRSQGGQGAVASAAGREHSRGRP